MYDMKHSHNLFETLPPVLELKDPVSLHKSILIYHSTKQFFNSEFVKNQIQHLRNRPLQHVQKRKNVLLFFRAVQ